MGERLIAIKVKSERVINREPMPITPKFKVTKILAIVASKAGNGNGNWHP